MPFADIKSYRSYRYNDGVAAPICRASAIDGLMPSVTGQARAGRATSSAFADIRHRSAETFAHRTRIQYDEHGIVLICCLALPGAANDYSTPGLAHLGWPRDDSGKMSCPVAYA